MKSRSLYSLLLTLTLLVVTLMALKVQASFSRSSAAPDGVAACTPFSDDLEPAPDPGWTFQVAQNDAIGSPTWAAMADPNAHSLTTSFFSDASNPTGVKDDRLIAPPQNVSATSHLIFWHSFSFEDGFDGGVLEVSNDGGNTWVDVGPGAFISGGYTGTIDTGFDSPIAGQQAWTGNSGSYPAMNRVEVNLGAFAGSGVLVRWRLALDSITFGPATGWYVDDIEFTCTGATPTPTPPQSRCTAPYIQVVGTGSPADVPADPTQGELTIEHINIGEPFTTCADNSVTFLFKVNNLDPAGSGMATLPPNAQWKISFAVTGTDNVDHNVFVGMDTFATTMATVTAPNFSLGRIDPSAAGGGTISTTSCSSLNACTAISGTFAADGTITIKLNLAAPIAFAAPGSTATGTAFTWDGSLPGVQLKSSVGDTYTIVGILLIGVQETAAGSTYTRAGNLGCGALPLAVLTSAPDPATGSVPLTVTFDGSTSTDSNPCSTLNSYTMDFGDGSLPVTQVAPSFMHTYSTMGTYTASLIVGNTAGQVSINPAEITVTANQEVSPVTLLSVVSRKTHGVPGDFDIDMPLTGGPGIECRSAGANGDYQLVFTFSNTLVSVQSAALSRGIGSVSGGSIVGSQYIVNLTGVTNAQTLEVRLTLVQDINGGSPTVDGPPVGILIGDTTANRTVNSSDIGQAKANSGQATTSANFRTDVTFNGSINSSDIGTVKSNSGTSLP